MYRGIPFRVYVPYCFSGHRVEGQRLDFVHMLSDLNLKQYSLDNWWSWSGENWSFLINLRSWGKGQYQTAYLYIKSI